MTASGNVKVQNKKSKMGMKAKEHIYQTILGFFLLLIALAMVVPFLYVIVISFTDASVYESGKFMLWPEKWSTAAYELILSGSGFLNALKSTLIITFIGTPLSVAVNAGLAYMLSKPIPGKGFLNKYVMFTMLFSAGMVPNYMNIQSLGLIDNYFACILPSACGAWSVMVMRSFFQSLPIELEEAAEIDGCGKLRIFSIIVIPLSKAMLATMTLFSFVGYWNTYFNAVMYMTSTAKSPLQVYVQKIVLSSNISDVVDIQNMITNPVPQEVMRMAAVVVVVLPILIIYPFMQKYFKTGMMVGAVKG
ncbi:MAG TPA: carbohydrate ABC transporter permease [Candidatus Limivivens intestinipullorum]|uniref:Carbohydrate ABC transporter permease n=1 Tax=Candidatus Limivivens intestinipullorum TaxID=2840858 RepID=A0A9D1ERJ1_9FIRM|nr:carbohydrate ABC transporter permease [Candidatus Limivivens intestinipullorum]